MLVVNVAMVRNGYADYLIRLKTVNAFIGWQVEVLQWERMEFLNLKNKHFKTSG